MAFIGKDCIALIIDMCQELAHKEKFEPVLEELKKRGCKEPLSLEWQLKWLVELAFEEADDEKRIQYLVHFLRFSIENASLLYSFGEASFLEFKTAFIAKCDECIRKRIHTDLMNYYKARFPKSFSAL